MGSRLRESLAGQGRHEVFTGTRTARVDATPAGRHVVTLDWQDERSLEAACRGMDAVVHVSGMNAAQAAADPDGALAAYGAGTARLLAAAARQGVSRLLYVSSAHVYGDALAGVVDERVAPQPRHPYALGHAAAEQALRGPPPGIRIVIARLANSFGAPAGANTDCWKLLANDLARQAVRTRRLVLRTAGTQRRDFIAMSEACRALVHLLELPEERLGDGLFNVGGAAWSVIEMASQVQARVAALRGFSPQIVTGEGRDPTGDQLAQYSTARLLGTGFAPRDDAFVAELDRLISYCTENA